MNTHPTVKNFPPARRARRGIALIVVLFTVLVLTLIVIAILNNGTSEIRSSKVYANGSSVKLLAQSAVNIVLAEINDGTKGLDSGGNPLCWASQPGMIRTYNTSGKAVGYYKLYSDSGMIGTTSFDFTQSANSVPPKWFNQQGVYVDLNEPAEVNGTNYYPIVDGNPNDYTATTNTPSAPPLISGTSAKTIGQTSSTSTPQVAGFWIDPQNTPAQPSTTNQEAPMPVKWLYVLKDGSVIVPDPYNGTTTVTFSSASNLTSSNPIVGRMAFWTDDESCKINVNTASESEPTSTNISPGDATSVTGSFIDTPRVCTKYDESMAVYPPAQNEFQRYPGHPATVSLSTVFGSWTSDKNYPENIYALTPRVNNGGSQEGTVPYVATASTSNTNSAISLRTDRLYDTPDEFLFQQFTSSSTNRILNSGPNLTSTNLADTTQTGFTTSNELDGTALAKAKFFITASSRAPDVNLFNEPRVCMWPISSISGTNNRTAFDNVIAFCETLGGTGSSNISLLSAGRCSDNCRKGLGKLDRVQRYCPQPNAPQLSPQHVGPVDPGIRQLHPGDGIILGIR